MKNDCKRIGRSLWICFAVQFLGGIIVGFGGRNEGIINVLLAIVLTLSSYLAYRYLKNNNHIEIGKKDFQNNFPLKILGSSFLNILGLNLVITLFMQALNWLFGFNIDTAQVEVSNNLLSNIGVFIQVVIVAPIFEELLFRGAILRTLDRYNRTFAILASSFLFALMHMNLTQLFFTFCLGCIMAHYSLKYDSMKVNIAIHFMNNLWAMLVTFITLYGPTYLVAFLSYVMFFVMIVGVICLLKNIINLAKNIELESFPDELISYTFFNVPTILLWIVSVISMIGNLLSI